MKKLELRRGLELCPAAVTLTVTAHGLPAASTAGTGIFFLKEISLVVGVAHRGVHDGKPSSSSPDTSKFCVFDFAPS